MTLMIQKKILSIFPYYDLVNGYKTCLMINEKYIDCIDMDFLYKFHVYVNNIQNVFIKYIIYIETIYKTRLAYSLANCIGDHQDLYLNKNEYSGSSMKNTLIDEILNTMYNTKDNPCKHYRNKPNIPPWILLKNLSFSQSIGLSRYLTKDAKQDFFNNILILNSKISFDQKTDLILSSIELIRTFRNKFVHNLNAIDYKHNIKYSPSKDVIRKAINNLEILSKNDIKKKKIGFNDTYCLILCIYLYLQDSFLQKEFLFELIFNMLGYKDNEKIKYFSYYCKSTNLPLDLKNRLINFIQ